MIDLFFLDVFRVLSCPSWSTFLLCGSRVPIKLLDRVVSCARFLTECVYECHIAYRLICSSTV